MVWPVHRGGCAADVRPCVVRKVVLDVPGVAVVETPTATSKSRVHAVGRRSSRASMT